MAKWYERNARDLPWRRTQDPYQIWLSEIILQQTRVDQGLPYYEKFIRRYPNVFALARAPEDEIKKMWEGLGYYRRADMMMRTARVIAEEYGGRFPRTAEELARLPGIGPYTAAAVASFAFDRPEAVVDGNVLRVLARLDGSDVPVNTTEGKKYFGNLARALLDPDHPARHNQALMEFGALRCVPGRPDCDTCPLRYHCAAYSDGTVEILPVKKPRKSPRERFMYYFPVVRNRKVAVRKRTEKDIWRGLYELPLIESDRPLTSGELNRRWQALTGSRETLPPPVDSRTHILTHRKLRIRFIEARSVPKGFQWVDIESLRNIAFPVVLRKFLEDWINMSNFDPK
ncbi:MAG: A/G-specific adenine glycosylase [Chlorobi bacterium]|nr:A/G-specific adenine glycosylase [Chlorobiota bacterium]